MERAGGQQFFGRALCEDAAFAQKQGVIKDIDDLFGIMGDVNDGQSVFQRQLANGGKEVGAVVDIQSAARFV